MVDGCKVCLVFLLIYFFRAANRRRKMRNKLRIFNGCSTLKKASLTGADTGYIRGTFWRADVRPRRAWSLPRPQGWFNLMLNAPIYNYDPYWREHFRMSRRTFQFVVNLIINSMEKEILDSGKQLA